MKKLLTLLLCGIGLCTMSVPVLAASESNDDLSGLISEIVTTANDLFPEQLERPVNEDDIVLNNMERIYVGVNVFKEDTSNVEELIKSFGCDGYLYELPVYIGNDTILVNIAKGEPLNSSVDYTEEEKADVLENVGKWQVTAIKFYENQIINYDNVIQNKIEEVPENVILVGGLPCFRFAVALIPNNNGVVTDIVPLREVPGIENISKFLSGSHSYNYEQIKQYINTLPEPKPGEMGRYGFYIDEKVTDYKVIIAAVGLFFISLAAGTIFIIIVKRRIKN